MSTDTTKDGGSAFPMSRAHFTPGGDRMVSADWTPGMSLRDWFAGQALAGHVASEDSRTYTGGCSIEQWRADLAATDARYCYSLADAMLAAREGGSE